MTAGAIEPRRPGPGGYIVTLEPVQVRTGNWSVRVTVSRGGVLVQTVDLSKELTFATREEALTHGAEFADELARQLSGG